MMKKMKSGLLPIFLILTLAFVDEVNAGKIVGKLESANGLMDKELVARNANSKYLPKYLEDGLQLIAFIWEEFFCLYLHHNCSQTSSKGQG